MPNPDVEDLIKLYKEAQIKIILEMSGAANRGAKGTAAFKRAMLSSVNRELGALQGKSEKWVKNNIPLAYKEGLSQADKVLAAQYKAAGKKPPKFPGEFAVLHKEAIEALVGGSTDSFDGLIRFTGRNIDDMIAQAVREATTSKIATGSTISNAQAALIEALKSKGITAFKFKRAGKTVFLQLDSYAAMVIRSTVAEVQNQASLRQTKEVGGDLVKMTRHSPTCPICWPLQGRVYSITGKTKGYPRLEVAYTSGFANIHPNCKHRVNPYIRELKSPAQIATDKAFSNRPLEIDDMTKAAQGIFNAQIKAYNAAQKANIAILNNRRQLQRYQARLGPDAPKTFSAFMRIKNNDGDTWSRLQNQYRAIGAGRE